MLPPIPPTALLPEFHEADWRYARAIAARGDTYVHLPTLRALTHRAWLDANQLSGPMGFRESRGGFGADVVEFGVRDVCTTWAFLAARPRSLVSVDIADPPALELDAAYAAATEEGIDFRFVKSDTLALEPVSCDLLFIDTKHTYQQLRGELALHAGGVRRFIAFHDTMSFGDVGDDGTRPGLQAAVEDLCDGEIRGTGKWALRYHDERCAGLAVVERLG